MNPFQIQDGEDDYLIEIFGGNEVIPRRNNPITKLRNWLKAFWLRF
jgi:hypothetical protein